MKKQVKNVFFASMAFLMATGCSSSSESTSPIVDLNDAVTINLNLERMSESTSQNSNPFTRAGLNPMHETEIKNVKVFFIRDGKVIYCPSNVDLSAATGKLTVPMNSITKRLLSEGLIDVYTLVNATDVKQQSIQTIEDLEEIMVSSSLNSNNPANFVMSGVVEQQSLDSTSDLNITVRRAASKFNLTISFDGEMFTNDISKHTELPYVESVSVRFKNYNTNTYVFPLNNRNVAPGGLQASADMELVNLNSGDYGTKDITFALDNPVYSYVNTWRLSTMDTDATSFDVQVVTYYKGEQNQKKYNLRLNENNSFNGLEIEANKSYKVSAYVNKLSEGDIDSEVGVEGWDKEDVGGSLVTKEYIYIKDSKSVVVSDKDITPIRLNVVLGSANQKNDLRIENLSAIGRDFHYDLEEAGRLKISEKNRINNQKLRRAVEYIYKDERTSKPESFIIPGTSETIKIKRETARETDNIQVLIQGSGKNRIISLSSKKPLNYMNKIISFDVVDSKSGVRKRIQITHKDKFTLSTQYPLTAGVLQLLPIASWNKMKQSVEQLAPKSYDFVEGLLYRDLRKQRDMYERDGAIIIEANADLSYADVRIPAQEEKSISIPVIFTGMDFVAIFDVFNLLTYKQHVVSEALSNSKTISPKFMVGTQSAVLKYINVQQAQAYCNTYWEVVKDPITGEVRRYTNFRLPTPAELDAIVGFEKDVKNSGTRRVLDNSLGLLGLPHVDKELHYWSSHGLVALDREAGRGKLHNNIKELLHKVIKIGNVRCVRDFAKSEVLNDYNYEYL